MIAILLMSLLLTLNPASDDPIITAENVTRLQPVASIDFEGDFNTGWFVMDETGTQFLVINADQEVLLIDGDTTTTFSVEGVEGDPATLIDAALHTNDAGQVIPATLHSDSENYYVRYGETVVSGDAAEQPRTIWQTEDNVGVEFAPFDDAPYILDIPREATTLDDLEPRPYPPAEDPEALVRIGRIDPPLVITSSPEGLVKRWDLRTGEVTAEAQVENGPAVFGQINAAGTHLAWRDPMSENLYLLDFETGENQLVAPLDGQYVQFFLLSHNADLIFGTHIDDEPILAAWDVETGERYDLGGYRECGRVLDVTRLSADGTTLVIGCDLGLEIWRIGEDD